MTFQYFNALIHEPIFTVFIGVTFIVSIILILLGNYSSRHRDEAEDGAPDMTPLLWGFGYTGLCFGILWAVVMQ